MSIQGRGSSVGALGVPMMSSSACSRRLSNTRIWLPQGYWYISVIFMAVFPHGMVSSTPAIGTEPALPSNTHGAHVEARGSLIRKPAPRDLHSGHAGMSEAGEGCIRSQLWWKTIDPTNYEFGCEEIEDIFKGNMTLIGQGHIRDVYLVESGGRLVVVKTLREQVSLWRQKARFVMHRKEMLSMDAVKGHPNIIGMLGVCNTTLVTEYYPVNFSLEVLRRKKTPPIRAVIEMALGAGRGLQALHEAVEGPIVHFDIKPQQLLIDETGRVMINDFNMAHFMGTSPDGTPCPFTTNGVIRAVAWRSPESIAGKPMTEKVDIYSMGMVFYSLISGRVPFSGERSSTNVEQPTIDPSWHGGYIKVVQDMWRREPSDRPSAREVVERLEAILKRFPEPEIQEGR